MNENQSTSVDISMSSIIKILIVLIGLAFLYFIRDVALIIFVSLVLASAIDPWIDNLQKKRRWPRWLSILLIFVLAIGIVVLTISLLVPAIANQVGQLTENFPDVINNLLSSVDTETKQGNELVNSIQDGLKSISDSLSTIAGSVFSGLAGLFGGIVMLIGVIFLTFYMTMVENGIEKLVRAVSPAQYQPYLLRLVRRIQERLGLWLRGQLILGLIIGALSFVGLAILGVPYALVLALVAGITELVPIVGPILGAIPAVFIALTISPWKALFVIILYIVIQQLENNLIVPKVMQRAVGLNPMVVIIVMLIGAKLAGIMGIIMAVPVTIIGDSFIHDFMDKRKRHQTFIEGDDNRSPPEESE
ncbi:AI-2E family transporter [Patescibacteria group bacterium]